MSGMAVGGLGALAGALLGVGGGAAKGAIGGGVMALLGSLGVSAIKTMNQPGGCERHKFNAAGSAGTPKRQRSGSQAVHLLSNMKLMRSNIELQYRLSIGYCIK